ncbi:MAG TPA: hypothetical protein VMV37_03215, partial [Gammaproteobacteria bacterium]|nr:hypothetical protein [Gammaproteobacteria bacterium]
KAELVDACDTLFTARKVSTYAGVSPSPWCGVLFFEGDHTSADKLCEKVGGVIAGYERTAEELQGMRSVPDVVAIADTAGFLVDPIDTSNRGSSVRGFAGDGVAVLLNSLLSQIARSRDANGAEFERTSLPHPVVILARI